VLGFENLQVLRNIIRFASWSEITFNLEATIVDHDQTAGILFSLIKIYIILFLVKNNRKYLNSTSVGPD
jgi:hypothetical protein